jgi:metallopeptidase MepB
MFYTMFKHDLMNHNQGLKYRREVLEKGARQDEMKTLMDFLGRRPNMEAFYRDLGLG